jgi:protein farnesyltransferase subunit beta
MTLAPSVFTLPHVPQPTNSRPTATLEEQAETESLIFELLKLVSTTEEDDDQKAANAGLHLRKGDHVKYVCQTVNHLPAPYVSLDASRPWLLFWTMHSLDLLGCALDDETKKRYVQRQATRNAVRLTR